MTVTLETLLRDLQGALAVRRLYPADHPRFTDLVERVVNECGELTARHGDLALFMVDDRLVRNGAPVPAGDGLARGLFHLLRRQGVHQITLRPGLTRDELTAFPRGWPAALTVLPVVATRLPRHRTCGSRRSPRQRAIRSPRHRKRPLPRAAAARSKVWAGIVGERRLDLDALECTALALARTLEREMGKIIPLATLKTHDDYTVTHVINVALLAMALAEAMGLRPRLVREVGIAALLHDVGKLRVPQQILSGTEALTEAQRALIRRHPEDGARILLATDGVPDLAVIVAFEHHLHFDGGGYPSVPRSWRTNVASEITHVADVFDALRSDRPYRRGLSRDKIADIMTADAGTVFDPKVVDRFFESVVPRTVSAEAA